MITKILFKFSESYTLCLDEGMLDENGNPMAGICIGTYSGDPLSCGYLFVLAILD